MARIKKIVVLALLSLNLINLTLSGDTCGTPVECYTQGISFLKSAKYELNNGIDKLTNMTAGLKNYLDQQLNLDKARLSKLESSYAPLKSKLDQVYNNMNSRIADANNRMRNHACREASTGCNDDGKGNLFFFDRHNIDCGQNQFIKRWQYIRCSTNQFRIYYICCRLP